MVMDNVVQDDDVRTKNSHLFFNCNKNPAEFIFMANEEWPSDGLHFIWII